MQSLAPVTSSLAGATGVGRTSPRALPFSGAAFALTLSGCAHAALALAFAHAALRSNPGPAAPRAALVEIVAPDLVLTEAPASPAPAPDEPREPPHAQLDSVRPGRAVTQPERAVHDTRPTPGLANVVPPPAVVDSPAPAAPRFVLTVGSGARAPGGATAPTASAAAALPGATGAPVAEAAVDTSARMLAGNSPSYTPAAEAAGVEADVPLEIVVDELGAVVSARGLAHVGYGLDEAALRAIRAYRFSPAHRAGKALAVRMRWVMRFQLR